MLRKSIRAKLFLMFSGMVVVLVGLTFLLNYIMLPKFYLLRREEVLKENFIEIVRLINTDDIRDINNPLNSKQRLAFNSKLAAIESKNAVRIILSDSAFDFVYGNDNVYTFSEGTTVSKKAAFSKEDSFSYKDTCYNVILEVRENDDTGLEYIGIFGGCFFSDEYYVISVDTTLDAINDSVSISNDFLMLSSVITMLFGGIVFYFISQQFVKPVVTLNTAAKRMAVLDFSEKVEVSTSDEVGELAQSVNELSTKLEDTIASLKTANRQLQLDIINRDKTDLMRQEFISNVSHELKTPISLILGYAEGLKVGINEEDKDFYCDVIMDEAQNMSKMVSRLLYISQLDSGAMKPETSRFELVAVINNVLENLSLQYNNLGITVTRHFDYEGEIFADLDQIRQVVTNYITNAIHHCIGEMRIDISTRLTAEKKVRFSVFNTGEPIAAEAMPHLWESFFKVDKARTREYGGTGLGLYIVSRIISNHGGVYGVSNVDDGVKFWFELDS